MSRLVSRAESWEKVYTAFSNINFAAFDYNTIKQSILDYIKLYFPESFNDFIESSELIAIVESFCYIAELIAYRVDVTTHENFLTTAQRRDSILKLAKLISYRASRPLPARGLVKITSVSTTETILDASGANLSGKTIRWNDTSSDTWKDQFLLVINRVLDQQFGTVVASDRFQMQDVLFEIYPTVTTTNVLPYTANVYGDSISMELVPVAKQTGDVFSGAISGITERRPSPNAQFTLLYGSDGLGDSSDTTGFFCYTKQGTLQQFTATFDGITPNISYDIPVNNINDTDVWVNNIDPTTGDIIVKSSTATSVYNKDSTLGKYGEWVEVDIAHSQNIVFNTNPKRNKYETETIANNRVRLLFGDGEFADVPQGTFDIWVRSSVDEDIVIPQSSIVDKTITFTYTDDYSQTQTFTFTVSLISSLQNASAAETTEHIRHTAPAVYYTQDRMVNGEDYNVYLRQNPTVLKLRAVNRTFAGDSKYITWHDSSNTYENVKIFGDDGILYIQDRSIEQTTPSVETNTLISTYIEPLLSSTDIFVQMVTNGVDYTKLRRVFNADEKTRLVDALTPPPALRSVDMYYNTFTNEWYSIKTNSDNMIDDMTVGGYQIIDMNGYASSVDKAVTYSSGTSNPTATFVISSSFGNVTVGVTATTLPTTFSELLSLVNTRIAQYGCTATLSDGNIIIKVVKNTSSPTISVVTVTETTSNKLFGNIVVSTNSSVSIKPAVSGYAYPVNFITEPLISLRQVTEQDTQFVVSRLARRIVVESQTTSFWNANTANRVMDYDTLRSSYDVLSILRANVNCNRDGVLQSNWNYNILGQEIVESGEDAGMADIHRVSVLSVDENNDHIADNLNINDDVTYKGIANIINPKIHKTITSNATITLPTNFVVGFDDVTVTATLLNGNVVNVTAPVFNIPTSTTGISPDKFGIQTVPSSLGWYETDATGSVLQYGQVGTTIKIVNVAQPINITIRVNEYVYFYRQSVDSEWLPVSTNAENILQYVDDYLSFNYKVQKLSNVDYSTPTRTDNCTDKSQSVGGVYSADDATVLQYDMKRQWRRYVGRNDLNFAWMHFSPRYHLVDPSPTNIIDMFIITRGYFISFKRWLEDPLAAKPDAPTPLSLRNDYSKLLDNKMASDTVILHPGSIKLLFGDKASTALQARIKVIRSANSTMTDNQIKNTIVATVRNFFDIAGFEFGETFYFTELATAIHMDLYTEISSVVLVPTLANSQFGDLMSVFAREDEILYPDIGVEDIDIITGFNATNLRLNG